MFFFCFYFRFFFFFEKKRKNLFFSDNSYRFFCLFFLLVQNFNYSNKTFFFLFTFFLSPLFSIILFFLFCTFFLKFIIFATNFSEQSFPTRAYRKFQIYLSCSSSSFTTQNLFHFVFKTTVQHRLQHFPYISFLQEYKIN